MLTPQFVLPLARELVIDLFAGGGGASTGIEEAIGRHVDIAVNHDREAVALHQANHPQTKHYVEDVFEVDPLEVTEGRPVGLLWASPDCKHFSKAKGGKPVDKRIRGLAWVVVKWAKLIRPRVIFLENVEEFQTWGPLTADNMPCPRRKGRTFKRWVGSLKSLGYSVEFREIAADTLGTPTIRKRFYMVARCDGQPIAWPAATHGPGLKKRRTAAECIDWTLNCPSIFLSKEEGAELGVKRPLADATMRRIAKGVMRYVVNAAEPFIVPLTHHGENRRESVQEPFKTVTGAHRGEKALIVPKAERIPTFEEWYSATKGLGGSREEYDRLYEDVLAPFLTEHANASTQRTFPADEPLRTQMAQVKGGHFALVAPTLVGRHSDHGGAATRAARLDVPTNTITGSGGPALVAAFLAQHNNHRGVVPSDGRSADAPTSTVTGKGCQQSVVAATLVHYQGEKSGADVRASSPAQPLKTQTTENRHAVVSATLVPNTTGNAATSPTDPLKTVATGGHHMLAAANMIKLRGTSNDAPADGPLHTISAGGFHHAEVRAFLTKYYGTDQDPNLREPLHTCTTKDRFGLVTVKGEPYQIVDIGMRMLTPRELYRAQGFKDSYQIDFGTDPFTGERMKLTKTAQVRMCGNSVCPPVAAALVRANYTEQAHVERELEAA